MTEYINKEQLDRKFIIEMLSPRTRTIFDAKDIIDSLPTADVIERSKIDKAIEEIKEQSYLSYDDNPRRILDEECVLEILKRNIGE